MGAKAFRFRSTEDLTLEGALLVVGFPTVGYVAQVAAHHLIEAQELRFIGAFHSPSLPPMVVLQDGAPAPPFRVFAGPQVCGLDRECNQLAVLAGDAIPPEDLQQQLAQDIVAWANEAGVESLVILEGIPLMETPDTGPRIIGAATTQDGRDMLTRSEIPLLNGMLVRGMTGALLAAGMESDVNVLVLFVEARAEFQDHRAAAALVGGVDGFLLHIPIDAAPLLKRAEELTTRMRQVHDRTRHAADTAMYG